MNVSDLLLVEFQRLWFDAGLSPPGVEIIELEHECSFFRILVCLDDLWESFAFDVLFIFFEELLILFIVFLEKKRRHDSFLIL